MKTSGSVSELPKVQAAAVSSLVPGQKHTCSGISPVLAKLKLYKFPLILREKLRLSSGALRPSCNSWNEGWNPLGTS